MRQVFDDTRGTRRQNRFTTKIRQRLERLAYDRTEVTLHHARKRKEIFLLPGNNSVQILRALRLADEWKIRAVLYGGQQGYAVTDALAVAEQDSRAGEPEVAGAAERCRPAGRADFT